MSISGLPEETITEVRQKASAQVAKWDEALRKKQTAQLAMADREGRRAAAAERTLQAQAKINELKEILRRGIADDGTPRLELTEEQYVVPKGRALPSQSRSRQRLGSSHASQRQPTQNTCRISRLFNEFVFQTCHG